LLLFEYKYMQESFKITVAMTKTRLHKLKLIFSYFFF